MPMGKQSGPHSLVRAPIVRQFVLCESVERMTISRGSGFASDLFVRQSLQMRIALSVLTKFAIFLFLFQNSKEPTIIVTRAIALIFTCQFLLVIDCRFAPKKLHVRVRDEVRYFYREGTGIASRGTPSLHLHH
jgi:hypothetical protein